MKNNQVNKLGCEDQSTWILPGLLCVSLVCNSVLLYVQPLTNPQPAVDAFSADMLASIEKTSLKDQQEDRLLHSSQEVQHWHVFYEKGDEEFVKALKALGMPDAMVHAFAMGRASIERLQKEEQLLFDTPYWKDTSHSLTLVHSQSAERMQSLTKTIFGEERSEENSTERVRRRYMQLRLSHHIPPHQQGSGLKASMYFERLHQEEMKELSAFLSADELAAYELRHSGDARRMASLLGKMDPDKDEFTKIMQMKADQEIIMQAMSSGTDWTDTTFNEDQWDNYDRIVKQLETGLGKERFEAFNYTQIPMYSYARAFQNEYALSDETFDQIIQIGIASMGKGNLSRRYSNRRSDGHLPYRNKLKQMITADTYAAFVQHLSYFFPVGFFEE